MPLHALRNAWHFNRLITLVSLLHLLLIPLLLIGMVVDPKVITGVNGWLKPLKFAISIPIYSLTIIWLLTYIEGRRRLVQIIASVTGITMFAETALITVQVLRNTTSHFNVATALDAVIFSAMGTAITLLAIVNLLTVILLSMQRLGNPVFAAALRLGTLISFIGMLLAFLMTSGPTPSQLAALNAGAQPTSIGAHSVGVEDGGAGLPILGWNTIGGDLRVPHFVGLHGLQLLPLLGFWLTRRGARRHLREGQRLTMIWTAGLGYMGWVGILTWQALRGQSVVTMDLWTGLAYLILVSVVAIALSTTLRWPTTIDSVATNPLSNA